MSKCSQWKQQEEHRFPENLWANIFPSAMTSEVPTTFIQASSTHFGQRIEAKNIFYMSQQEMYQACKGQSQTAGHWTQYKGCLVHGDKMTGGFSTSANQVVG